MKKLYRKNTVHPSPPLVSDKLAFLPAAILAITAALSPDDQEALAYLISCPSGNFSANRTTTTTSSSSDHPPSFNCYCFNCYMSYWVRWDSSPNRQLIHQVIDAYEDGLQSKKEKSRRERRRNNKDCGSSSAGELKKSEVILNEDESDEPNMAEESPNGGGGEEEDGYGEEGGAERGAVRRFVSFLGERIWGSVWA